MNPVLNGLYNTEITLYTTDNIKPGMAVKFNDDKSVSPVGKFDSFIGICTASRGNYVTVAVSGIVTVPYTGTAPELGHSTISGGAEGYLIYDLDGDYKYIVLDVNEEKNLFTVIL